MLLTSCLEMRSKFRRSQMQMLKHRRRVSLISFGVLTFSFVALVMFLFVPQHPDMHEKPFEVEIASRIEGNVWDLPAYNYGPCIGPSTAHTAPHYWEHYLLVQSNGGLNQMRAGVSIPPCL
eukprot:TRINITY_DN40106_c0_g1_i1.p1 TRINITY_DN40106_c0_g1~~TRINITY_DN40106_c0_g1_i1.p1  ORF type:complete len:121 (-),score=9.31 TRINITY_DN40106_c0_g1_i1:11-373(-)